MINEGISLEVLKYARKDLDGIRSAYKELARIFRFYTRFSISYYLKAPSRRLPIYPLIFLIEIFPVLFALKISLFRPRSLLSRVVSIVLFRLSMFW